MINRQQAKALLAAPLAAMLLAGCVSQSSYDELKAKSDAQEQQIGTLQSQLASSQAQVNRLHEAIKYTVNSDLLFKSGSWEMTPQGKKIIARLAQKLAPTQENKLVVNGYTDNTPIGPELQKQGVTTNQDLSQKRADAVMAFLISQGVKQDLVSAQGHGDANPVASNDTAQGRAKNRRVELTIGGPAA